MSTKIFIALDAASNEPQIVYEALEESLRACYSRQRKAGNSIWPELDAEIVTLRRLRERIRRGVSR